MQGSKSGRECDGKGVSGLVGKRKRKEKGKRSEQIRKGVREKTQGGSVIEQTQGECGSEGVREQTGRECEGEGVVREKHRREYDGANNKGECA